EAGAGTPDHFVVRVADVAQESVVAVDVAVLVGRIDGHVHRALPEDALEQLARAPLLGHVDDSPDDRGRAARVDRLAGAEHGAHFAVGAAHLYRGFAGPPGALDLRVERLALDGVHEQAELDPVAADDLGTAVTD